MQPSHIARNCSQKKEGAPRGDANNSGDNLDPLAAHKPRDHVCETCSKVGHTSAQCWIAYPELIQEALVKKRQKAIAAAARKRQRAGDHCWIPDNRGLTGIIVIRISIASAVSV